MFLAACKLDNAAIMNLKEVGWDCVDFVDLLGCTAVVLIECRPTFQRCVLPPSSGL
jgi:hypothetical protein